MDVFAQLLGDRERMMLFSQTLEIPREVAAQLAEPDCGLYFDWGPDSGHYHAHVREHPDPKSLPEFLEAVLRNPALLSKESSE